MAKWDGSKWYEIGAENTNNLYWNVWAIELLENDLIVVASEFQEPVHKYCVSQYSASDVFPFQTPDILTYEVYPNPATEKIAIKGRLIEIKIVDVFGHSVIKKQIDEIQEVTNIQVSNLSTGLYYMVGKNAENQLIVKKFIKN